MKDVLKNPLFWIGLTVKIVFLFGGGAQNFHQLFIPFLDKAVQHWGENPWSFFPTHYFPYGSLQFLFFALPKTIFYWLFGEGALGNTALSYFSLKIVLLIFDTALFVRLLKLAGSNGKKLIFYYWLNPILFYISYVHGQLDVVPMFFSITALTYLVRKEILQFSILAGFAAICKFHTVAILPFTMAFLWNTNFRREGLQKIVISLGVITLIAGIGLFPQLMSGQISQVSLGSPEAMSIFGIQIQVDSQRVIFLGLLIITGILARLCVSTRITPDGLIFGSGLVYGSLLLAASPGAGWYFWFLPFVALFYSTRAFKFHSVLIGCVGLYLLHFILMDFFSSPEFRFWQSITFSLLQFTVICLMVSIWVSVIRYEAPLLRRIRPLMIGLAGNSGSGKNTMTEVIQDLFGTKDASVIEGDDYHKWERGNERWQDYTHLNPKANFLDNMANHTRALRTGKLIQQPHYDHSSGKFTEPRPMEPSKNLIVQGLHTFYMESLRQLFDIKIFMAPEEELRRAWKIQRDVKERGHDYEKVMQSLRLREADSREHIYPQRKMADWVISSSFRKNSNEDMTATEIVAPEFEMKHVIWNDTPMGPLVENLAQIAAVKTFIEISSENIDQIEVSFEGSPRAEQIGIVAEASFPFLRHLVRSSHKPVWRAGKDGLSQLILLALIDRQNLVRETT